MILSVIHQDEVSEISSQALSQVSPRPDEFNSDAIVLNYELDVSEGLIDRCATALSHNEMVTKRDVSAGANSVERLRVLARRKAM